MSTTFCFAVDPLLLLGGMSDLGEPESVETMIIAVATINATPRQTNFQCSFNRSCIE
jgi:hypothetical protein